METVEPQTASENIFIGDLDKAAVLASLYNTARPQGLGFLQYTPTAMTIDEARKILAKAAEWPCFDYLSGRVLKVDLKGDSFSPRLFDRDNGSGVAKYVIGLLRAHGNVNSREMQFIHENGVDTALSEVLGIRREQERDA